jgi:antitoxin component of MazEF toxin-antitoxin module
MDDTEPDYISIEGPVERIGNELVLRIPLMAGGLELQPLIQRGSRIEGDFLVVAIPPALAEHLRVAEGSLVIVDSQENRFNITRSDSNDEQAH